MVNGGTRLGEIEPRERAGAQTGRKYEYQYERTARAALNLLADGLKQVCVYCDWHDDYVIELDESPSRYEFYQVKGRNTSRGPWGFGEFFGVGMKESKTPLKKPASVKTNAVVPLMLLHHCNFRDNCAGLVFVTNAGLDPKLSKFLEMLSSAGTVTMLPDGARIAFDYIAQAYTAAATPLAPSASDLFAWLRGIKVHTDQGHLESADAALLELADIVVEYSEIELLQRQAKQIAREIVNRVRRKAAHNTTTVPTSDERLRSDKGIVITELLRELSLSTEAYEELKAGAGSDTVKTLSRLQRFCTKRGLEAHLVHICDFKARWDSWRTIERHSLRSADYVLLERKAHEVLKAQLTMEKIVGEAKSIAKQFAALTTTPLTPEHVMGLIFSLAAQSEALEQLSTQ
jgi:hypothetical protein